MRANAAMPQTTGNPLDVWVASAPIFQPLPDPDEIEDICRQIDASRPVAPPPGAPHWTERMAQAAAATQRDGRKGRILLPPQPPPQPHTISDYWRDRPAPFPIEGVQMRNASPIHFLLSAFVDATPQPSAAAGDDPADGVIHALPPRMEFDYLSFPFEERLRFELESAGLGRPPTGAAQTLFAQEIEHFSAELDRIQKVIERYRCELVENLAEWQRDEARRAADQQEFAALLRDHRMRPHRR